MGSEVIVRGYGDNVSCATQCSIIPDDVLYFGLAELPIAEQIAVARAVEPARAEVDAAAVVSQGKVYLFQGGWGCLYGVDRYPSVAFERRDIGVMQGDIKLTGLTRAEELRSTVYAERFNREVLRLLGESQTPAAAPRQSPRCTGGFTSQR